MPKRSEDREDADARRRLEMGRRIRAAREKAGFRTGREFAAKLGVKPATLSGWEKGHYSPSLSNFNRIIELTRERSSYLNPENLVGRDSLASMANQLAARLGAARLKRLLEMPEPRLLREIDSAIGSYVVSPHPTKRKTKSNH